MTVVLRLELPAATRFSAFAITRPVPLVPPARLSATFAVPALIAPVRTSEPPLDVRIRTSPLLVRTLPTPIVRLSASVTVSVEPAPLMLALSVPTAVLRVAVLLADTVRTLPTTWPVTFRSRATDRVTSPLLPAFTSPETFRSPPATLTAMAPLFVTRLPLTDRPLASLTVSVEPMPVMLAMSVLTLVLREVLLVAVTFSTFPTI